MTAHTNPLSTCPGCADAKEMIRRASNFRLKQALHAVMRIQHAEAIELDQLTTDTAIERKAVKDE